MDVRALLVEDGPHRVTRLSIKDTIAEKIATLIASGVLRVGDELPSERELALALSVSRETVRGAILILSTRGVLQVVHGARTTVVSEEVGDLAVAASRFRSVARYELDDIHEARLALEAHLAKSAARAIDAPTLERLQASIEVQMACRDDPVRYLICDREFHTLIYRAGGNAVLADLAADLYAYHLDHRRRIVGEPGRIAVSIEDHRAILAGLKAGDPDRVADAFAIHETRIYTTTREWLAGETGAPDRP